MNLKQQIINLQNSGVKQTVDQRLKEFSSFVDKGNEDWFSELCFCLLTANSRASSAMNIQNQIGVNGFLRSPQENIANAIKSNKHRFHNNKAKYIVNAREFYNIKDILADKGEVDSRTWLVENIKGLGMKEASHFLRNTGGAKLAILDRHIINVLLDRGYLLDRPKTLTPKRYLEIEETFNQIAKSFEMSSAELDLYMWYMKTGIVLK